MFVAAGIFSNSSGNGGALDLTFTATGTSLQAGLLVGFLISIITVLVMALTTSRLNVIRAIRDLPDPTVIGRKRRWLVQGGILVLMGSAMLMAGASSSNGVLLLIGPLVLAIGAIRLLRGRIPSRPLRSLASLGVLVWGVVAFNVFGKAFEHGGIGVFITQGFVLVIGALILITENQDAIGAAVRTIGGGAKNMSLRLGLAYPLAKRTRTALNLATYALVVFILTFITIISNMFAQQVDDFAAKISGGFSIRVQSNASNPIGVDSVRGMPGVTAVAPLLSAPAEYAAPKTKGKFKPWFQGATTFDQTLVDQGPPKLSLRPPRYADDRAAYQDVLTRPGLVIVSDFFLQDGAGPPGPPINPGEKVSVRDPLSGRTAELEVAARSEAGFGNAFVMVSPQTMREVFGDAATPTVLFVATAPGADGAAIAARINGDHVDNGADADTFHHIVEGILSNQLQVFGLMRGYLALGLLVGTAGLGVVSVRAVRDRRRQIGVLRSLGFSSVAVRRAFLAESTFVALEGVMTGLLLAIVASWRLIQTGTFGGDSTFRIPFVQLSVMIVGTVIAALLATAIPAIQASRIRPAVALRITD